MAIMILPRVLKNDKRRMHSRFEGDRSCADQRFSIWLCTSVLPVQQGLSIVAEEHELHGQKSWAKETSCTAKLFGQHGQRWECFISAGEGSNISESAGEIEGSSDGPVLGRRRSCLRP
jgi:hypothetical protein